MQKLRQELVFHAHCLQNKEVETVLYCFLFLGGSESQTCFSFKAKDVSEVGCSLGIYQKKKKILCTYTCNSAEPGFLLRQKM
jgi:hypothetical protein